MLVIILIIILILISCFAGVLLFGAPYLPTLAPQIDSALELADLKPNQILLELGCGDGRVLMAAADKGLNVIGYELNPLLAALAWLRTRRYDGKVRVIWGNFWTKDWPKADAIFVFLLEKYMNKLNKKCIQYPHKPLKLISFAFSIKDRKPDKLHNGVFLYTYK